MANKIEAIEGIGLAYSIKLRKAGVTTVEGLLQTGKDKTGRTQLAKATGIDESLLLKWVNIADLFRVKGIGSETSELLEAAGVDTVKELRNRNPENLLHALVELNREKKLVRRVPSAAQVVGFIEHAKTLDPQVTH